MFKILFEPKKKSVIGFKAWLELHKDKIKQTFCKLEYKKF